WSELHREAMPASKETGGRMASERQVVVVVGEEVAARLGRVGRLMIHRRRTAHLTAGAPTAASSVARLRTALAATTQHHHVLGDDLGHVSLIALLILPVARLQAAFDVHLTSLAQVLVADLGQPSPRDHPMPLGPLLALASIASAELLIGGEPAIDDGRSAGREPHLRGRSEVTDQHHLVEAPHVLGPFFDCAGAAGAWRGETSFPPRGARVLRQPL